MDKKTLEKELVNFMKNSTSNEIKTLVQMLHERSNTKKLAEILAKKT